MISLPAQLLQIPSNSSHSQVYESPTKTTNNSPLKGDSSQKRKKIKLTSGEQSSDTDLQTTLIIKAINNSFIQRMSGNYLQLDPNDLLTVITEFAINESRHPKRNQDLSVRQWCVVEVDERLLMDKQIGKLGNKPNLISSICGHKLTNQERHQYNIIDNTNFPNTVRPYCLILNMDCRELHFQSQEEPSNYFFINLDTVSVVFQEESWTDMQTLLSNQQNMRKYLNQPISLVVEDKDQSLVIHMYFTPLTLPFPFKEAASESQKYKYLISCRQSLYKILKNGITESRGRQLKLNKIIHQALKNQSRFYNSRYASEEQFVKYCESGDILLFKDLHTMAKVQRAITSSPYDHVAVVYKNQNLGICLFQSNSGLGVGLAPWRSLIRKHWFEGIQKIAWRKLQVDKKPSNFTEKIQQFVKGNLDKQFGLSLPKLLKFKSMTYSKESNKTYFCSELAAQLYKFLGLLDETKSSTQYWPKDFADGKGIQILNGALDPERELIFEHSLLKECYPGYTQ